MANSEAEWLVHDRHYHASKGIRTDSHQPVVFESKNSYEWEAGSLLPSPAGGDVYCFIIRKLPNAHQTDRKEALMTGIMALLDEVKHIGEDLGQLLFNGSHPTKWRHLPITERESSEAVWF